MSVAHYYLHINSNDNVYSTKNNGNISRQSLNWS